MKLLGTLVVALALSPFSTALARDAKITLTPAPTQSQTVEDFRGHQATQSATTSSGVALILTTRQVSSRAGPVFLAAIRNVGASPVNLQAADVVVKSDAGPVIMWTAEDLTELARQRVREMDSGGGDVAMARLPGNPALTQEYNRQQADRRVANAQARMGAAERLRREAVQAAEAVGFKPFTVAPGETVFAPVALRVLPDRATHIDVAIDVNGEVHTFVYTLARTY